MLSIIIVCVTLCVLIVANYCYKRTNCYHNKLKFVNCFSKEDVPYGIEIVNLGSGYARFSYDYSNMERKGFNFAHSPQCLRYDFKMLKQYKEHLKKNCIVLINLPLFIFAVDNYKELKYQQQYYFCLDKQYIDGYSILKK